MIEIRTLCIRVRSAMDAASLIKLLVSTLIFVVWRGSPLFALGAAFAMPVMLVMLIWIYRAIHLALTGRTPGAPPARLGLPLSHRRHNGRCS